MKNNKYIAIAGILIYCGLSLFSCQEKSTKTGEVSDTKNISDSGEVTNPLFKIAPLRYTDSSEKAFKLMAAFDFDAWAQMLADTVVYSFPDGDAATRTTLYGKDTLINWWKNSIATSGLQSIRVTEFNHVPINVISRPNDGFPMGIYDLVYFTTTILFEKDTVGLRMNFSVHFNADDKIDHYASYYDNDVILKGEGKGND